MKNKTDLQFFGQLTLLGLAFYVLSFIGYAFPIVGTISFFLILLVVFWFARKNLLFGVGALLFEVAIGVKGYLFSFALFGFPVSLRLALFILIFGLWFWDVVRNKRYVAFANTSLFKPFAVFTIMLVIGMIVGVLNGNDLKNIFFDANGYLYLAFMFPIFAVSLSKVAKKKLVSIVLAGSFALTLFSLFAALQFTIFHQDSRPDLADAISSELAIDDEEDEEQEKISHSVTAKEELNDPFLIARTFENKKPATYRWTQDVAIAEISYLAGPFFRVFSPGQIFSLFLFIFSLFVVLRKSLKKDVIASYVPDLPKGFYAALGIISFLTVILGFSRSLWLGLLASLVIFLLYIPFRKAVMLSLAAAACVILLGFGLSVASPQAYSLIERRVESIVNPSSESAGSNRLNVIDPAFDVVARNPVIGSGFGTTIEYESVVPEKFGTLRVFSFEWSYVDMLTEVGAVGLLLYIYFIYIIYARLGKRSNVLFQALILALLIINIATPYLNHPLGISLLLLAAALTSKNEEDA